ncbi:MAG: hypothetical protein ACJ74W_03555 [Pyrinomonadaceae bacterium]
MSHNPIAPMHYRDRAALEAVVRGFETCTIAPADFSHGLHLTVALWYVAHAPLAEAITQMRRNLQRFIAHHGVDPQKYNETITLFWLKFVRHFLDHAGADRPLPEVANELLARCGNSQLLFAHYSRELVLTNAAQTDWVEPDLRPLEF